MTKKVWEEPELVVLLRSRPEEAVLGKCKAPRPNHGGPLAEDFDCYKMPNFCEECHVSTET